jgi:hypothetical protein
MTGIKWAELLNILLLKFAEIRPFPGNFLSGEQADAGGASFQGEPPPASAAITVPGRSRKRWVDLLIDRLNESCCRCWGDAE